MVEKVAQGKFLRAIAISFPNQDALNLCCISTSQRMKKHSSVVAIDLDRFLSSGALSWSNLNADLSDKL